MPGLTARFFYCEQYNYVGLLSYNVSVQQHVITFHFTPTGFYPLTHTSAMSSRKRLSHKFDSLNNSTTPTNAAKIHRVLSKVSHMKGKFYDASIGDATTSMRIVGFYKDQRDKLAKFNDTPLGLDNCSIKKSKLSDDIKVVVNQSTLLLLN